MISGSFIRAVLTTLESIATNSVYELHGDLVSKGALFHQLTKI